VLDTKQQQNGEIVLDRIAQILVKAVTVHVERAVIFLRS
jgi:hypothetical protein